MDVKERFDGHLVTIGSGTFVTMRVMWEAKKRGKTCMSKTEIELEGMRGFNKKKEISNGYSPYSNVNKLVARGWLEKKKKKYQLTAKGEAVAQEMTRKHGEWRGDDSMQQVESNERPVTTYDDFDSNGIHDFD